MARGAISATSAAQLAMKSREDLELAEPRKASRQNEFERDRWI
jgi:hypothetical protein